MGWFLTQQPVTDVHMLVDVGKMDCRFQDGNINNRSL